MSSDKLSTIQEPLVSLDLDMNTVKGKKMVSVEMNKEDLKKMITSLEAASRVSNHFPCFRSIFSFTSIRN